jgi:uncharacterized protein (TIGR02453 family)
MGEKLASLSPHIIADPRTDKSIFRVHRDTRFSNDKRPYKTHLGIYFWEGPGKKMECSGYYFHLEPPDVFLGAGLYMLSRDQLSRYRDDVVHPKHGPALARAVAAVRKKGYDIGGLHYQRVPRGYDPEHKNAELLKHSGVFAMHETKIPPELYSSGIVDSCFKIFRAMSPVHEWMVKFTERG